MYKTTYLSIAFFEQVKHLNAIESLSSNTQHGCPGVQVHTFSFDHRCLI